MTLVFLCRPRLKAFDFSSSPFGKFGGVYVKMDLRSSCRVRKTQARCWACHCFPISTLFTLPQGSLNCILVIYCFKIDSPNLVIYPVTPSTDHGLCESVVQKGHGGNAVPSIWGGTVGSAGDACGGAGEPPPRGHPHALVWCPGQRTSSAGTVVQSAPVWLLQHGPMGQPRAQRGWATVNEE